MNPEKLTIEEIIARLKSDNPDERQAAAEALSERAAQGLDTNEGTIALKAASTEHPSSEEDFQEAAVNLIKAAATDPRTEYVPIIMDMYPKCDTRARTELLRLLAGIESREASVAYMGIVSTYARIGGVPALPTLQEKFPDVYFPAILDYADVEALEWDIYALLLSFVQQDLISADQLISCSTRIVDGYQKYRNNLISSQQKEGVDWMWQREYHEWRNVASLLLDIMGLIRSRETERLLREALTYNDPRLQYFAVVGLLRQGKEVDEEALKAVARSPEMRNFLYGELVELNRGSAFPEEFRTQEAFAESNMVNWLIFPTELGRVPDEIELMKTRSIDTKSDDGIIVYYLFRFRTNPPHWAAKDGWMAGVSGPFLQRDAPCTKAYGGTFSFFDSWDTMTPDEHVNKVLDSRRQI